MAAPGSTTAGPAPSVSESADVGSSSAAASTPEPAQTPSVVNPDIIGADKETHQNKELNGPLEDTTTNQTSVTLDQPKDVKDVQTTDEKIDFETKVDGEVRVSLRTISDAAATAASTAASVLPLPPHDFDEAVASKVVELSSEPTQPNASSVPAAQEPKYDADVVTVERQSTSGTTSSNSSQVEVEADSDTVVISPEDQVIAILEAMGFADAELNSIVIARESGSVEACAGTLASLSGWSKEMDDLLVMGFTDRRRNVDLMLKHGGDIRPVVKELVAS